MGVMMPYGAAIREALASNDLTKMEAIAEQAKQTIKQQGDLTAAYLELIEAIAALKTKKQLCCLVEIKVYPKNLKEQE